MLAIFVEGFHHIIFMNFKVFLTHDKPPPLLTMLDHTSLAIFVEGHLVTISVKLFSILTTGFKGKDL